MRHVRDMGGFDPYPVPTSKQVKGLPRKSEKGQTKDLLEEALDYKGRDLSWKSTLITYPQGFQMQIKKSGIDHWMAGYGVHAVGEEVIPAGSVLMLYPGYNLVARDVKNMDPRDLDDN